MSASQPERSLKLRPSSIGSYFHRGECERYLVSHSWIDGAGESLLSNDLSAAGELRVQRGNEFEEQVWASIKRESEQGLHLCDEFETVSETSFSPDTRALADYFFGLAAKQVDAASSVDGALTPPPLYVFQLPLASASVVQPAPPAGLGVALSRAYPDVIKVEVLQQERADVGQLLAQTEALSLKPSCDDDTHAGRRAFDAAVLRLPSGAPAQWRVRVTIVDIKSSMSVKTSHQAQLATYHIILQKHLTAERTGGLVEVADVGEIWRPTLSPEDPTLFIRSRVELAAATSQVSRLVKRVAQAAAAPSESFLEKPAWALHPGHCAECPVLEQCKGEASGKVKSLQWLTKEGCQDIEDLVSGRADDAPATLDDVGAFWTRSGKQARRELADVLRASTEEDLPGVLATHAAKQPVAKHAAVTRHLSQTPPSKEVVVALLAEDALAVGASEDLQGTRTRLRGFQIAVRAGGAAAAAAPETVCEAEGAPVSQLVEALHSIVFAADPEETLQLYTTTARERATLLGLVKDFIAAHTGPGSETRTKAVDLLSLLDDDSLGSLGVWRDRLSGLDWLRQAGGTGATKPVWQRAAEVLGCDPKGSVADLKKAAHAALVGSDAAHSDEAWWAGLAERMRAISSRPPALLSVVSLVESLYYLPVTGFSVAEDYPAVFTGEGTPLRSDERTVGLSCEELQGELRNRTSSAFALLAALRARGTPSTLQGRPVKAAELRAIFFDSAYDALNELLFVKQQELLDKEAALIAPESGAQATARVPPHMGLRLTQEGAARTLALAGTDGAEADAAAQTTLLEQEGAFRQGNWILEAVDADASIPARESFPDVLLAGCSVASPKKFASVRKLKLCDFVTADELLRDANGKLAPRLDRNIGPLKLFKTRTVCLPLYEGSELLGNLVVYQLCADDVVGQGDGTRQYKLSRRLVDATIYQAIDHLLTLTATPVKAESPASFVQTLLAEGPQCLNGASAPHASATPVSPSQAYWAFTPSQEDAFSHLTANRVQLVWGPPGTGKTYYLARAIVRHVEENVFSRPGATCNVAVSSFASPAFTELIALVHRLVRDRVAVFPQWQTALVGVLVSDKTWTVPAAYVGGPANPGANGRRAADFSPPTSENVTVRIVGCTTWAALKKGATYAYHDESAKMPPLKPLECWDVVVIDEASQMPAADATVLLSKLNPSTGKLVIAGDHLQLSPIYNCKYAPRIGRPDLAGSIFKALMRDQNNQPIHNIFDDLGRRHLHASVVKLTQNLRSNRTICALTQRLYGSDYAVPDTEGPKRLLLSGASPTSPHDGQRLPDRLQHALLTSAQPWRDGLLTIVVQDALSSEDKDRQREIEAMVVMAISQALRSCTTAANDDAFSAIVVTPTNAQKDTIRSEVGKQGSRMFAQVDTVNKAQGQTADVVFIAYSVECNTTFLNDIARVNVAFTRARSLSVLLVSSATVTPTSATLGSAEACHGYAHLAAFIAASSVLAVNPMGKTVQWLSDAQVAADVLSTS
eukprot:Rhum_TRINITY_DN2011_c0_g2::Rhum_TRINITY_DN2011_c0_g2_i1::g.5461::m.5461